MVSNHRIANIPEEDPDVICLTMDHSNLLTTPSWANRYINERLSLKSHLPDLFPTCLSASGASFATWPKKISSRDWTSGKYLKSWDLEMLPHFRDDCSLPDHLHDEVLEDISECTIIYRYA
ncbi:hypothetical protein TNCV_2010641 [Trichonephila clavipes]|nr:hypothetical protein TNCV_2010641 [Trichonephila clavipes]